MSRVLGWEKIGFWPKKGHFFGLKNENLKWPHFNQIAILSKVVIGGIRI